MADLKEQRRAGFYFKDNKTPYVTVTNVLKVIDKPALRYWYGKQVYLAMALDPTLDEKEALAAPYETNKKAINRGVTVHSIVEAWDKERTMIENLLPEHKGYAEAFYSFLADHPTIEPLEHEKTVFNDKYHYAGTLDLVCRFNPEGLQTILDVKTGRDIYPETNLQLSAYRDALERLTGQKYDTAMLLLKEDGKYKLEKGKDEFRGFLAALYLWAAVNRDVVEKIGWKGGEI